MVLVPVKKEPARTTSAPFPIFKDESTSLSQSVPLSTVEGTEVISKEKGLHPVYLSSADATLNLDWMKIVAIRSVLNVAADVPELSASLQHELGIINYKKCEKL